MDYRDAVSALSHLFTACWAVFATLILLRLTRGHGVGRWAVGVYGLTMVVLYLASGAFHSLIYQVTQADLDPEARVRAVRELWFAQRFDKSAIFALIAGSYTPVFVYLTTGAWRWGGLAAMWGIAAAGIGMVWLWPDHRHTLLVGFYVGMGLVGLLPLPVYLARLGWRPLLWVVGFGTAYIAGAAVEVMWWPTLVPGWFGPHELLHVSDTTGTFLHFIFVVKYLIPRPPPRDPVPEVAKELATSPGPVVVFAATPRNPARV